MLMPMRWNKLLIILFFLFVNVSFSQEKNPTVYPYGGVPDSSRYESWMDRIPLNFQKANFREAQFDSLANFEGAQFNGLADYIGVQFLAKAYFQEVHFDGLVKFQDAVFNEVIFNNARFNNEANFFRAQFKGTADFCNITQFDSSANFEAAKFDSVADFMNANFMKDAIFANGECHSIALFEQTTFYQKANFNEYRFFDLVKFTSSGIIGEAIFRNAKFYKDVDFRNSTLNGRADFSFSRFNGRIDFSNAVFNSKIDFRDAYFDEKSYYINFSSARIIDSLFIGTMKWDKPQKFDLRLAKFLPTGQYKAKILTHSCNKHNSYKFGVNNISAFGSGAKIVLYGPIELKIQYDQLSFIILPDKMDYFTKKFIIDGTKQASFNSDEYKSERFELDYIFAKSTIYQDKSANYLENRWYYVWKYPSWFLNTLYYITMGLGYRPFRLAWWVLGFIISFGIFYFFKMRDSINGYILKKFEMKESSGTKRKKDVNEVSHISHTESLMNCFYFSSMLLFSFRLKGEILTFFNLKEKRYIVGEYLLGLLIYISFLTLAKSGSILHNLRSLFVG